MKNRLAAFLFILVATMLFSSSRPICQETYTIGILLSDSQQDQQLKTMLKDVLAFLSTGGSQKITPVWFTDSAKFMAAAKNNELSFAYSKEYDAFVILTRELGYMPLVTATFFGKKKLSTCMYAKKESPIKSAADIKGLRMTTYKTKDGYYPLRLLLSEQKPEEFFAKLIPSESGVNSLNMLIEGKTDLAWVHEGNVHAMKLGNPAVVKTIKEVMCSAPEYNAAISYKSNVPKEFVEKVRAILEQAHDSSVLEKYKPLIKKTKLRFVSVTPQDFKSVYDLYDKAEKKGWEKDQEKWLASVKK